MEGPTFVDECTVHVQGGRGGNGVVAFRREAHVPRGGPEGGDGGNGGAVVLVAERNTTSLLDLHRHPHQRAPGGQHGSGDLKAGADGGDLEVPVPVGTVVYDHETGAMLADLDRPGVRWVAARGGRGGRGNAAFKNRFRRAPRFAESGERTRERLLRLELKLIADVGLVGFPSAGKSSLIARLSAAHPRVAAYPFTTLAPNLGVVRVGDPGDPDGTDLVLADVPGLIEGASEGRGLGHRFLRHVERCHALVHVLDAFPFDPDRDPLRDLDVVLEELRRHDPALVERPSLVALNKVDLPDGQAMAEMVGPELEARGLEVFEISALTGQGLDALRWRLGQIVTAARAEQTAGDLSSEELFVHLPAKGQPDFAVERDLDGTYLVRGERVERWVQMLPLDNPEAVRYLQGRLRRAGVDRALAEAGARSGDEVTIGEATFEFDPDLDDLPADEREALLADEDDDRERPDLPEAWPDVETDDAGLDDGEAPRAGRDVR